MSRGPTDASDNAPNHLSKMQDLVLRCGSSIICFNLGHFLLHQVLEDNVRVEELSVLASKPASDIGVSVKSEKVATIFLPYTLGLLLFRSWNAFFGHLVVVLIRAGFPLAVRLFTAGHLVRLFVARARFSLAVRIFFTRCEEYL